MRFSFLTAAVVALAAEGAIASTWFSKAAYNKWHETELERWLSDHDVPYPTPADRKDLIDLVNNHWEDKIATPYNSWDTNQLQSYLSTKGHQAKKSTEKNKDSLLSQVKQYWHETADQASDSYSNVQSWIFDSWTESNLKAFLDYHSIPNPTPRTRDSLLQTARSNYQAIANKAGETFAYPGDWLYQSWSDSDLKAWLDERGIPAPQPSSRDKLVASVRRNARVAANKASEAYASASSSAAGAQQSLTDALLDSWSDSQIKEWADKNGIKVPQGSKRNELLALARKHRAKFSGDNVASSASSAYGAATSSAGNQFAAATDGILSQGKYWYDYALNQFGMASAEAKSSLSSLSISASVSASSASKVAASSLSSASKVASSSLSSASKVASSSASSASSVAPSSASSAGKVASSSASSAGTVASSSASSAGKVASSSASSAASVASKSASSAASVGSKSAKSAASVASKSGSSLVQDAGKSASGYAQKATDAAAEAASSAKHAASEAAQRATDRVKEEL